MITLQSRPSNERPAVTSKKSVWRQHVPYAKLQRPENIIFPQTPVAAILEKYMSPTAQLDSLDVPMRQKVHCLQIIDWFVSAGSCNPSIFKCNIWSQLQFSINTLQSTNKNHSRFDLWIYILAIGQGLDDDIQPINHPTRNPVPWKRPWPRQRDRCRLTGGKHWDGAYQDQGSPNQQKNRWKYSTDISGMHSSWYFFVCLFVCLFVAGSLMIWFSLPTRFLCPSFLMAESKITKWRSVMLRFWSRTLNR